LKITSSTLSLWTNYVKKPWVLVPNINFLNYKNMLIISFILASVHAYSKWIVLNQRENFIDLIHLFGSIIMSNIFTTIFALSGIRYLNLRYPKDNIPARNIIFLFAFIGSARSIVLDYLQVTFEFDEPFEYALDLWFFTLTVDIGDYLNGIALGFVISSVIIYYALFCASNLKIRQAIIRERLGLHQEIELIESELEVLENGIEEKIYQEIIEKIDLKEMFNDFEKKSKVQNLEDFLRVKIAGKLRNVSADLLAKEEKRFGRNLIAARNFINETPLILNPIWFTILAVTMSLGNNASINLYSRIEFTTLNLIFCGFILYLIKRYFLVRLEKHYLNCNLLLIFSALLSLASEISGLIANYDLAIEFRIQRFVFFFFLLIFISFASNMTNTRKDMVKDQDEVKEMAEKLDYLKNVLSTMREEISEHLHGYLVFQVHEIANKSKLIDLQDESLTNLRKQLTESFSYQNYSILTKNFLLNQPSLYRLASQWDGLMEIRFTGDIDQISEMPPAQSRETWNVIIELINNAYRHGSASKIDFDFDFRTKGFLKLCAVNDGRAIKPNGKAGLGSSTINVASDGNWSIANVKNGGVMVNVQIEFYTHESVTKRKNIRKTRS